MINLAGHQQTLADRLLVANRLLDDTHRTPGQTGVSREARGLAVILIYAAYENLLKQLTTDLLDVAISMRVSNKRLHPRFRTFAIESAVQSSRALSERKSFSGLTAIADAASRSSRPCSIHPDSFPSDGSFFKQSQIRFWCDTFQVGDPAPILHRIWQRINTVVTQRNQIAHGSSEPQDIGRSYTEAEMRSLIADWQSSWDAFLIHINTLASHRDFYRTPR